MADLKDRSPRWAKAVAGSVTRAYALRTAALRPVPDFLVIGSKRGGTTSLFRYLSDHPGTFGLFPQPRGKKSTDFFFPGQHHPRPRSEEWYRSHFHTENYRRLVARRLGYRPLSFEASPYYIWDPRVAGRVRDIAPEIKAILVIRNPVRRAWSHYQERVQNGVEPLTFKQALAAESDRLDGELDRMLVDPRYYSRAFDWYSYRSRGEYLPQIMNWHAHFPADQLLVLRSDDLYRDTQRTMDLVCNFLALPTHRMQSTKPFNSTWRTTEAVPTQEGQELADHFKVHNLLLEEYLETRLGWS
ncbi:sulfotransferase family protein [Ornithinimicrobium cavernae]|uniref:sulfotransferase family protein n=1 Tax=Ornithinimicrobium cavernae TaxID=2666047 RepID=UPI001F3A8F68|nr:sulfotransferase [Ornithinimicrobium cavernae]